MQQQRSRQSNVVAANYGHHKILLKTVDNNVVVLAVSVAQGVQPEYELCSAFGTGNSFRYLAAHEIAIDQRRHMYSLFHSLTGVTLYIALMVRRRSGPFCQNTLLTLSSAPIGTPYDVLHTIKRLVIFLYDGTSTCKDIDRHGGTCC